MLGYIRETMFAQLTRLHIHGFGNWEKSVNFGARFYTRETRFSHHAISPNRHAALGLILRQIIGNWFKDGPISNLIPDDHVSHIICCQRKRANINAYMPIRQFPFIIIDDRNIGKIGFIDEKGLHSDP